MRVVFIITSLVTGGAQAMLFKLLQNLDRNRFAPWVITLAGKGDIGLHIESLGIPVHALGMKPGIPSPIKFMRLVRLLRRLRPDVIHTWMYHADLLGGLAARLAGIKAVAWAIRNGDLSKKRSKLATRAVMKACAIASPWLPRSIVTCSEQAGAIHVAAGYCADKLVSLPNGFDLSRFRPDVWARAAVRAELALAPDTLLVGLVARHDPQKNHPGFIEVAARVHGVLPQVHFVLAGAGIDWHNDGLTALVNQASLTERVHLLGRRDDMPRLMASFDLLVSASSYGEAFPNVLGEAMACGVPCVVTDVGDSAEIVGNTGRVVAPGDMAGLARRLTELLQWSAEQRAQLGVLARQRIGDHYEIGDITRRYQAFYVQLMQGA